MSIYSEYGADKRKIEYVKSDEQNVQKVRNDRVSYILGFLPKMEPYLDELAVDKRTPLAEIPDSIVCHNNEATAQFIKELNEGLRSQSQELQAKTIKDALYAKEARRQLLLKDLLVDILPPPLYVIEAHLIATEIYLVGLHGSSDNKVEETKPYFEKFDNKKERYDERIKEWKEKKLGAHEDKLFKDYLLTAATTASRYLSKKAQLQSGLVNNQPSFLRDLYQNALLPTYKQHRNQIDTLVAEVLAQKESAGNDYELQEQLNEFLQDILPPPLYIVEVQLLSHRMMLDLIEDKGKNLENLLATYNVLMGDKTKTDSYHGSRAKWNQILKLQLKSEEKVARLFEAAHSSVEAYSRVFASKFLPALKKKDQAQAEKILLNELTQLFSKHEAQVLELVKAIEESRNRKLVKKSQAQSTVLLK